MVCRTAHANYEESLDQDGDAECVHCKAGRVDFEAEDVHYALAWVCTGVEEGGGKGRGRDGGQGGFAWCVTVRKEHAVLAGKLLEGDGDEGADAAYNKDLGELVWGASMGS